jgi:hypothetical protein
MVISFADAIVVIPLPLFPLLQLRLKLKTNNYLRDEVQLDPISLTSRNPFTISYS